MIKTLARLITPILGYGSTKMRCAFFCPLKLNALNKSNKPSHNPSQQKTRLKSLRSKTVFIALSLFLTCISPLSAQQNPAQRVENLNHSLKTDLKHNISLLKPASKKEVVMGMYLNDVQAIDLKLHNYMVDFYIWYRWDNPDLDPAASMEFVNHSESWSSMLTNVYEKPEKLEGGSFYQVTHVQGKMSKKMDLHDYPFDQQLIRIVIEDNANDVSALKYKVEGVSVNSELKLPGFLYQQPVISSEDYIHQTTFGDPRSTTASTYSRVTMDLPISRPHINAFMKNIVPILLAVVCCSLAFVLHPTLVDSRFQIAVVSLLSIVALQMTSSQDLPTIEYMTLLDKLYVIGYFFCIFVVAALTISTKIAHIHDDEPSAQAIKSAKRFDRTIGSLCFICYLITTLWTMAPMFHSFR